MSETVIQIEDVSKQYRLGVIGSGRLIDDVSRSWARLRGKPDPLAKVVGRSKAGANGSAEQESDTIWALKNVSLEVKSGEVLGIIGRNGAGKSTLLKILSRVTAPTTGEVRMKGRVASLLEVGTGFHPELTGRENVFLNGAILGMTKSEIRSRFDEIVAFAEIEKFIDTPVKRYSSGMFVRLAFAVAAHLEPEILIVDEVLAVGDAAFQEKCLGKMEKVAGEGRTVLLVSHNMSTIQQLCKRSILFRQGEIHRIGLPAEVVSDYLSDSRPGGSVEIRDWQDRKNSGDARLTRLSMTNDKNEPTATFFLGDSITFHIEAEMYQPLVNPNFGIVIHDSVGDPLVELQSGHDGLRVGTAKGSIKIITKIKNVGLYPGKYLLSPWVRAASRDVDRPYLCGSFQILPKPGKWGDLQLNPKRGKYHIDSTWTLTR